MTQQNKKGIRLRPAFDTRKKDELLAARILISMISSVVVSLSFATLTGNGLAAVIVVMVAVSVLVCAIYGVFIKSEHESWFYIGVLALVLVLMTVCRQQALEGFRIFWNRASDAMLMGTGEIIPEWELLLSAKNKTLYAALFSVVVSALTALFICAVVTFAPVILAVLMPIGLLFGMSAFGTGTGFVWLLPVLFTAVIILMYSSWRKTGSVVPMIMSLSICGIVACMLILSTYLPFVQRFTKATYDSVHELIHEVKYETKNSVLPEGDFSDYSVSKAKPVSVLSVTMEIPQAMYLRGFTGDVFTGECWEPLNKEALVKNKQLLYWLNLNAFNPNAQFDAAARQANIEKSSVYIENTGACSYYRYVPFNISKGDWTQNENLNTDGAYGEGERDYMYSVVGQSGDSITYVLNHLQSSDDESVLQYRKAESAYRQFVNHYYLQVPEDVRNLLSDKWDDIASYYGGADNLTIQQAQDCTLSFLSQCFTEEGKNEDMDLPLEMADGTIFQYATTATMTLRYFGIPARYAEGYFISEEMASSVRSGEALDVDTTAARAWVEVYQDGLGWIPMDLTSGMGEVLESPDTNDSEDGLGKSKKKTEKKEKEKPEKEEEPAPTGGTMVRVIMESALRGILKIALVVFLVFLALFLRRKLMLSKKQKLFDSEDISESAAWIYADSALLMEKMGFNRGNGSMRSLKIPIEEKYGTEFAEQFELASTLNERAIFSSEPLSEEERDFVLEFRKNVLDKLNSEEKWYKRMWFMWGLCLY